MSSEVLDKTVVVKVGSECANETAAASIMQQIVALREHGYEVLLVVSGAVLLGRRKLGIEKTPNESVPVKKMCSVPGQIMLMQMYQKYVPAGYALGQILVDRQALSRANNGSMGKVSGLFSTMQAMRESRSDTKIINTFNYNDACHDEELEAFGDNDNLALELAGALAIQKSAKHKNKADGLILLTNADGLYENYSEPVNKILIPEVIIPYRGAFDFDEYAAKFRPEKKSDDSNGTGDISSKVRVALSAAYIGIDKVAIANANADRVLEQIIMNRERVIGTMFRAAKYNKSVHGDPNNGIDPSHG